MATYYISHRGNMAIQQECWVLTLEEAATLAKSRLMAAERGSYWDSNFVQPFRRAKRAKAAMMRLSTAGFTTGELSNALFSVGIDATERASY